MPVRSATNAIRVPSGESVGELARPTLAIRATVAARSPDDCDTVKAGDRIDKDESTSPVSGRSITEACDWRGMEEAPP